jgi:hypothetical protein
MADKAVFGILLAIVILAAFALEDVSSGCVTYSEARAQGVKGTDAELGRMGFCAGTAAQTDAPSPASPTSQSAPAGISTGASELSSKSVDELNSLHMQLHNTWSAGLYDPGMYDRSAFDNAMKTVWEMRSKELDDSWKRTQECDNACSGEKFQRGGGGQACVQPCYDRANAEGKKVIAEIERLEKAAYIDDISRLQAALRGSASEVKGSLPKGPGFNINDNQGRTPLGKIAPSMGGYLGDAYVERPDGTKVIPGKELYLKVDDKVMTGEESKVNIIFGNAGRMNLGPNTILRVGSALLDQYYLAKGTLKTTLEGQKLEIRTPTASIFNKGTEFVTEYNETTNTTTVYLYSGELEIQSIKQTMTLSAGNYCTIGPDGTITSAPLTSSGWNALGERFYEEPDQKATNERFANIFFWSSFISLVVSASVAIIFFYREKKHKKEAHKHNLGWPSILFGVIGLLFCVFPMVGFPLTFASTTLARIQKLRNPTISAKIGHFIGITAAVLNGTSFLIFFAYLGSL